MQRDAERLTSAASRADACPLGSGALAGCAFPLDRTALARDLGFSRITANSLDAVSDRDFALEFLFALATLAMHLSRLSEDMILFASPEFGFVELPDEYSTGSSLMPQKKNPDAWELIRGKTGRMYGALLALLTTCKGLPSSYQRDLQEDKEACLRGSRSGARDGADRRSHSGRDAFPRGSPARGRAGSGRSSPPSWPTISSRRAVPFREAHEIVGKVLRAAEQDGKSIRELPIARLKEFSPAFGADFAAALTLEASLDRRAVPGGTAPKAVRAALDDFKARLAKIEENR